MKNIVTQQLYSLTIYKNALNELLLTVVHDLNLPKPRLILVFGASTRSTECAHWCTDKQPSFGLHKYRALLISKMKAFLIAADVWHIRGSSNSNSNIEEFVNTGNKITWLCSQLVLALSSLKCDYKVI